MKALLVVMMLAVAPAWGQSKQDILNMVDQMQKSGAFTPEQIAAAKERLNGMSDEEVNSMVQKGKAAAQDPKMRAKAQQIIQKYKAKGGKIPDGDVPADNGVNP